MSNTPLQEAETQELTAPLTSTEPDWLDEILIKAFNDFYDYMYERNVVKAAEEYANKTIYKEAHAAITAHLLEVIGDDEQMPIGEMGKFDPVTRSYELLSDTDAVKYHMQRVMNRNDLRKEQRLAVLVTSKNKGEE